MLWFLLILAELILTAGIAVLLFVLPVSFLVMVLWIICILPVLIVFQPALRLSRRLTEKRRRVLRRGKLHKKTENTLHRPSSIPPACLSRLLEATGIMKPLHAKTSAILATLLDLNCRGLIDLRIDGESEPVLSVRSDTEKDAVLPFEKQLLTMLEKSMHPANRVRISIFVEYAAHHCASMQCKTDRFFSRMDRYLRQSGYLKTGYRRRGTILPHRMTVMTPKALKETGAWCTYLGALCAHPALDAYPEQMPLFEKELERAFVYSVAGGIYGIARENLLREFLFAPQTIWNENQFLRRVTYDDDSVIRLLWNVIRNIQSYGTPRYHADDWEEHLEEARDGVGF